MSSQKHSQRTTKVQFTGRLPRFLAGPPITFTDSANDNFMRFFFNLLSSSSHNAEIFKTTVGHIQKHAQETQLCYCDGQTTPVAKQCYQENLLKERLKEYLLELEANRKELAQYVSKNPGCMVLLSLLSRGLMGSSFEKASDYTKAIEDQVAFKFLGGKFGYRLEQVDSLYQFTGKVADFDIQIGFQLLGGNHSDVVEVLKFRAQTPKAPKFEERSGFDEETQSVEVDAAFQPKQPPKKVSKWEKVRQAFISRPNKHETPRKPQGNNEPSTGVKEQHNDETSELPKKTFDYLNSHERPLLRDHEYNLRYRV